MPACRLTPEGQRLWHVSEAALSQIDREIELKLRGWGQRRTVTVGMLTYFSSRWLSPRLTRFFEAHPGVGLRIEPLSSIETLRSVSVDLAVLWGIGDWRSLRHELLLDCPAVPTGNAATAENSKTGYWRGYQEACHYWATVPVSLAGAPGMKPRDFLIGPAGRASSFQDSNSRVQAVIDGQGLALWDSLVTPEFEAGTLVPVSKIWLEASGYYIVHPKPGLSRAAAAFQDWILSEAGQKTAS